MSKVKSPSLEEVKNILKSTSKGQLKYDRTWQQEGRTEQVVNEIKDRLLSLTLSPDCVTTKYEDISPERERENWDDVPVIQRPRKSGSFGIFDSGDSLPFIKESYDKSEATEDYQETINCSPEAARQQLIDFEQKRKQEVQEQIKKNEAFLFEQLRDIDYEADDRLRRIRAKHANDYLDRIYKLNQSLNDYMNQVVQSADRLSSPVISSPEIEQRLRDVENKKKQLQSQQDAEAAEQTRVERIEKIKSLAAPAVDSAEKCLIFLPKVLHDQRYVLPEDIRQEFEECNASLASITSSLTSIIANQEPRQEDVDLVSKYSNDVATTRRRILETKKRLQETIQKDQEEPATSAAQTTEHNQSSQPIVETPVSSTRPLTAGSTTKSSIHGLKEYARRQKMVLEAEERLKPFVDDMDNRVKQYRVKLQLFIRTQINAISPESNDHFRQKYQKLAALFEGKSIEFQDNEINVKGHPLAADFAMIYAAKTFLAVGLKQVLSVPKASFGFGAIICLLWSRFPAVFGEVFMSLMADKCPYILGYYPSRGPSETEVHHLVSCGYTFAADGETLESEESFLNRMRAYTRIYGAVIASRHPLSDNHPHAMKNAWNFLSATLSLEPRPGITAAVLHAFLSVCCHRLFDVYKSQFFKLLVFLLREYIPKIEANSSQELKKQSVVQLKMFLEETLKKIPKQGSKGIKPEGVLSDYFWQKSYLHS